MRKWYLILFFILLFLFYGKDLLFSFFIMQDETLKEKIILESDYNLLKNDYEKLLEENQLWNTQETEFITSKVVVRDPYLFFDEVTILKGTEDNVRVGDIVINSLGYIGRVKVSYKNYSHVELLTNKNTQLQVRVKSSYGILKKENGLLKISEMTSKENISIGDIVTTSSLSDMLGDIVVGKVTEIKTNPLGQELIIHPSVDFSNLSYVTIRKKGDVYES